MIAGAITKPLISKQRSLGVDDIKKMVESLLIEAGAFGVCNWDYVLADALYLCMMVATEDGVGDHRPRNIHGYHTRLKDVVLTVTKTDGNVTFKADILSKPAKGDR